MPRLRGSWSTGWERGWGVSLVLRGSVWKRCPFWGWLCAALAVLVGVLAVAIPTASATATVCVGDISGTTVRGGLIVPADQTCTLTNATVMGSVTVRTGAILRSTDTTITGSLSGDGAQVRVCGGQINGSVSITHTPEVVTPGLRGSFLDGDSFLSGCSTLTIRGSVRLTDNTAHFLQVAGANIDGSLLVRGNTSAPLVLAFNTVRGSMRVTNNIPTPLPGGSLVALNTVTGTLACFNNTGLFFGSNTAHHLAGQCATAT